MTIGVLSTVAQKNRKGQTAKSRRVNFGARILFRSALAGLVIVVAGVASAAPPDVAAGLAAVQRLKSSYRNNGASMDFERRYPAQVWIDLAAALDRQYEQATYRWGVEAVNAALDRELERMQAASRAPHRLLAMTRSLDNDRDLLRHCLVLPRVAHRLDELVAANELDPGQTKSSGDRDGTWHWWVSSMAFDTLQFHSALWTGSEMIVWGGTGGGHELDTGGCYEPATDTWTPTTTADAPASRSSHRAVWTGSEMIVWGGLHDGGFPDDGGRYDPVTNSWTPLATLGAPDPRAFFEAVWTGSEMIVWGGGDFSMSPMATGGRYDPASDSWTPTTTTNVPLARNSFIAVWTGTEMIVWGGLVFNVMPPIITNTGGRYNPATDTWTATSTTGAPSARSCHVGVWTGSQMIVWGSCTHDDTAVAMIQPATPGSTPTPQPRPMVVPTRQQCGPAAR